MAHLRWFTAGESHGPQLTIMVQNLPAGLPVLAEDINVDLARRQKGYGRGGRQQIETDRVEIVAGVRHGRTMGGPPSRVFWLLAAFVLTVVGLALALAVAQQNAYLVPGRYLLPALPAVVMLLAAGWRT